TWASSSWASTWCSTCSWPSCWTTWTRSTTQRRLAAPAAKVAGQAWAPHPATPCQARTLTCTAISPCRLGPKGGSPAPPPPLPPPGPVAGGPWTPWPWTAASTPPPPPTPATPWQHHPQIQGLSGSRQDPPALPLCALPPPTLATSRPPTPPAPWPAAAPVCSRCRP
ncbi:hypothetical protein V8C86DRAFT_2877930, partial [Haematococcus lacustris]